MCNAMLRPVAVRNGVGGGNGGGGGGGGGGGRGRGRGRGGRGGSRDISWHANERADQAFY